MKAAVVWPVNVIVISWFWSMLGAAALPTWAVDQDRVWPVAGTPVTVGSASGAPLSVVLSGRTMVVLPATYCQFGGHVVRRR